MDYKKDAPQFVPDEVKGTVDTVEDLLAHIIKTVRDIQTRSEDGTQVKDIFLTLDDLADLAHRVWDLVQDPVVEKVTETFWDRIHKIFS